MTLVEVNGVRLNVDVQGHGPLVVLVMGSGSPGRVWHMHQVPALLAAGYRVATFDNRGILPSDCADGFTLDDMVVDTGAIIEHLGAPAAVVGTSLGARIVQELMLARPDLVTCGVLMATVGRSQPVLRALAAGELELHEAGIVLPDAYRAAVALLQNLSPHTVDDPGSAEEWLALFEFSSRPSGIEAKAQARLGDAPDRLSAYRAIRRPCLVIGFADDVLVPPARGREVAEAVPGARFELVDGCGHLGYLERPDAVNALLLDFLAAQHGAARRHCVS